MRWRAGVVCVGVVGGLLMASAGGQDCPHGRVVDAAGAAVAGAVVVGRSGVGEREEVKAGADGGFALRCLAGWGREGTVSASGAGLVSDATVPGPDGSVVVTMRPNPLAEQVTVTTTRSSVAIGPEAQTAVALDAAELRQFPALTLDERLRQVAGFELFRRASSWVANPTSQGVSLRGLGSTAASRTLVLADGAPLNDPFGGWVHWNEIPPDAIAGVTVATGGGSDLYGSSALGGVIDVLPAQPRTTMVQGSMAAAGEDTSDGHGRVDAAEGRWGASAAGEGFRTAGYLPIAPGLAGPIDRPANVHYQSGRVVLERRAGAERAPSGRLFLTGNLLNEARGNGTALQTNGSRIWRWMGGDELTAGSRTAGRVRVFGSDETYRQTFTSINAERTVETLTRVQRTPTEEVGGSADATVHWGEAAVVAGVDVRDLRANDAERATIGSQAGVTQATSARQRFVGGFAEGLAARGGWSVAASVRVDSAENLNAVVRSFGPDGVMSRTASALPDRNEVVVSPRLGLVRELPHGFALHASGFRAFRAPTMNELYRQGQVGQELTLANAQLRSERATGAEGGGSWHPAGGQIAAEATYFWTEINRPVSAVLLSSTATTITNQRQNLGQIQSQGVELRVRLNEGHAISAAVGYQYAHAVVTQFSAQPGLISRWIPQVPRQSVTAQLRAAGKRWGVVTVAARASGQAFDDSSNRYPLHRFFAMDVYAERGVGRGFSTFVSVQNVLNQRMEVARTPLLTLGTPVLAQGGVRFVWGGERPAS